MSYPIGFTLDYHGFYFRSVFFPLALFVLAAYIAGYHRDLTNRGHLALMCLALAFATTPMLFQFQSNEFVQASSFWGLVDGFLSGTAALAMAAALRSIRFESIRWAVASALLASFCLWIKPSGLLVLAIIGVVWTALALQRLRWPLDFTRAEPARLLFLLWGLGSGIIICGTVLLLSFTSLYFSKTNIAFGRGALAVMKSEFRFLADLDLASLIVLMKISVGYAIPVALAVGLVLLAIHRELLLIGAVVLCMAGGLWFWAIESGLEVVRYFLPFPAMAFVLVVSAITDSVARSRSGLVILGLGALALPWAVTTTLLVAPVLSDYWQGAIGINLIADAYAAEDEQASDFLRQVSARGVQSACVYIYDTTPASRNFYAVIEYSWLANSQGARLSLALPRDWQRPSAFRLQDIIRCEFVAFEPVRDTASRREILARRRINGFRDEVELMNAWTTDLKYQDGVVVISETKVRVLRIADPARFQTAFSQLANSREWPKDFVDGNQGIIIAARSDNDATRLDVADVVRFRDDRLNGPVFDINSAKAAFVGNQVEVTVNITQHQHEADQPWVLFGHLVDERGQILANAQVNINEAQAKAGPVSRNYTLIYPSRPASVRAIAIGVFCQLQDRSLYHLRADSGRLDWEGRRALFDF
jgi:hypothetical protein